jgi:hypothetical protein
MCGNEGSGCKKQKAVSPEDCSPEQIRECHGDSAEHPCVTAKGCEHPEKLKGSKPGDCSPEQIRECHGDVAEHPCV